MPRKAVIEEVHTETKVVEKPKRTRKMTPELLEKLKAARELALKSKKEGKAINEELNQAKKETFSEKIDQVETYKKLKEKVDEEVKKNEIVLINKKMDELYSKFDGYLQEKTVRRQMKEQRKEQKKASQIVKELPNVISQQLLENEVKKLELERWRKRMFGV
jgi:hypothetical protein